MANANNNGNNSRNNTRKAVYSNGDLNSYDNHFTALAYRFYNQMGVIDLSPINPEFIGKQPKKGDKVYDHDNRLSVYISAATAMSMIHAINNLRFAYESEDEETTDFVRSVTVDFGNEAVGQREFTLYTPGRTKLSINGKPADTSDKFALRFAIEKDGEVTNATHVLQNSVIQHTFTKKSENDGEEQVIYMELELLVRFLEEVVGLATGSYRQGAALAAPRSTGGSTGSRSGFANTSFADEEDDEDEDEDDSEEVASPKKPSGKKRPSAPVGKKSTSKAALEDEFDEDTDA